MVCYGIFWSGQLQPSQQKFKTMLIQKFGGQIRCIMGNVELAYTLYLFGRDYLPEHSF